MRTDIKLHSDPEWEVWPPKKPWHYSQYHFNRFQVEITWLRWGLGFDVGKMHDTGISLWVGPFYLSVGL